MKNSPVRVGMPAAAGDLQWHQKEDEEEDEGEHCGYREEGRFSGEKGIRETACGYALASGLRERCCFVLL